MFKPFKLKDIYAYAEKLGYSQEDVIIEKSDDLDVVPHQVHFGHECTEFWSWDFEDLDGYAIDYSHEIVED